MKPAARETQQGSKKPKLSEARAAKNAARQAQQTRQRRKVLQSPWKRWRWVITLVVLVVLVGGVIWWARSQSGDIAGIVTYSNLSRDHVTGKVTYPQNPPVGGPHNAVWQ